MYEISIEDDFITNIVEIFNLPNFHPMISFSGVICYRYCKKLVVYGHHFHPWTRYSCRIATDNLRNSINYSEKSLITSLVFMLPKRLEAFREIEFQESMIISSVSRSLLEAEMYVRFKKASFSINMVIRVMLWMVCLGTPCLFYFSCISFTKYLGIHVSQEKQASLFKSVVLFPMSNFLGPAWIKLGQWASTRMDLFPPTITKSLSQLQHDAPSHPYSWTEKVIMDDLGAPIDSLFNSFEKDPIGSGSIAQVHRAILKATNQTVAVKVIHPNVEELLELDCAALSMLSRYATILFPVAHWLRISDQISYFSRSLRQQVDLETEAHNLSLFRYYFRNDRGIEFPEPYFPFVTKRILVERFQNGTGVQEFTDRAHYATNTTNREIVNALFKAFIKMSLLDNFVHADLHPGNILVVTSKQTNDKENVNPVYKLISWLKTKPLEPKTRVVLLDVGLVSHLPNEAFNNFRDLFKSVVLWRDGFTAGRLLLERSEIAIKNPDFPISGGSIENNDRKTLELYLKAIQPDVIDPIGFCNKVGKVVYNYFTSHPPPLSFHMPLEKYEIGPVLKQVFNIIRDHHVKLDPQYANFMMSVIFIEGLGRQLCPDLDLLPFFKQAAIHYFLLR